MVSDHWSNDAMVSMDRRGLILVLSPINTPAPWHLILIRTYLFWSVAEEEEDNGEKEEEVEASDVSMDIEDEQAAL